MRSTWLPTAARHAMVSSCPWLLVAVLSVTTASAAETVRVSSGLQVLYTFDAGQGNQVQDRSMIGPPLNLTIEKPSAVRWQTDGLVIRAATRITSSGPATRLIDALKQTRAVTLEAWIQPANDRQEGPARIVSISASPSLRNITLGQDSRTFDARLRTSSTTTNGMPSITTRPGTASTARAHVVYTRDPSGTARIYIDGKPAASKRIVGHLSNWDSRFRLLLGNEGSGDRPWLGKIHLVAIYSRALSAKEVQQNHRAGATAGYQPSRELVMHRRQRFFETRIAPLLARHCIDCHDSIAIKGGLDLSRKAPAMKGGKSGRVIIAGRSAESQLFKRVAANEMPKQGKPLTDADKTLLARWIDEGANWSGGLVDPAVYARDIHGIWIQRLTVDEYIETVRSAVGVDIAREARKLLPRDVRADGFSNTAYNLSVDLKHVQAYAKLAEIIVGRLNVLNFTARFSKSRKLSTDATMRKLVETMGKWLFRGPLEEREITNYSGIATTVASTGGDFREAASYIIEAMLQSPRFIYRIEHQRGDGSSWPVNDHELATRMSYIIWGAPPDRQLMKAADEGRLGDRKRVIAEATRMLTDPRAITQSFRFLSEWLDLDRLANLKPNPDRFGDFSPGLASDMRQETLAFFNEVAWKQKRPLSELLNAQFTYATPRLARHYGLEPRGPGLRRYDLNSVSSRGGLLTQGSVLSIGGDDASMVTRGLFVLQDFLRGRIKAPPPGVDTTPVPLKPGLSQRVVSEKRLANVACAGCHRRFEPIAFGLEKFDGLGGFRQIDEHGNRLRENGTILFPGDSKPRTFQSSADLMNLLANSERVRETITWKLAQFAVGRPLDATDAATIRSMHQVAWQAGGTWVDLVTALVSSDLVMMTRTQSDSANEPAAGTGRPSPPNTK